MTTASVQTSELGLSKARMVGVVTALSLAAIHLIEMPEDYAEMPYLGVLFGVGGVLLVVAAVGLMQSSSARVASATRSMLAAGRLLGYGMGRTGGLPGMEPEPWGEPLGVVSLVLEAALLAAAVVAFVAHSRSRESSTPTSRPTSTARV